MLDNEKIPQLVTLSYLKLSIPFSNFTRAFLMNHDMITKKFTTHLLATLILSLFSQVSFAQPGEKLIEIRSYNLKPGTRAAFNKLFEEQAVPMLKKWNIKVVAHGVSLHDENSYFLARAFADLNDRQKKEDAFYGSQDWETGPSKEILALIINFTTVVVPADLFYEKDKSAKK